MDAISDVAALRGLHLVALLSLLGVGIFRWIVLTPEADADSVLRRRLRLLTLVSAVLAVISAAGWLVAEAASMTGSGSLDSLLEAVPLVASGTRFGQTLLTRCGLVLLAAFATFLPGRRGAASTAIPVIAAAALQGLFGHAGAAQGSEGDSLLVSEALHVIAAGAWFGGLLPLWLAVGRLPAEQAASTCHRFTPIGLACVMVLAASGLLQGIDLIGGLPALLGTPYGHIALVKISLFLAALVLALLNRLWLTDRQTDTGSAGGLRLSIAVETLVGLAIVLAAGTLASTQPALHTQPVWPLPWRFSLETVNAEPEFREEVALSALSIGVAVAMVSITLMRGRMRLVALALCAIVIYARAPSFWLLTVEAYPTSFQTSPTRFATASILQGQALYPPNCARCHGPDGRADGPDAAHLPIRPIDLTEAHVLWHPDGELFWWLSHGMEGPDGNLVMPGFAPPLSADDVWSLIDYVRAHNAGWRIHRGEVPADPIAAPDFPLACGDLAASGLADLRGRAVVLVTDPVRVDLRVPPSEASVPVVTVGLRNGDRRPDLTCSAASDSAWAAYAVLAGVDPDHLAGTTFLIDSNGWLRAVHWPDAPVGWHTEAELIAMIRQICASPITAGGGVHEHHH